MNSEAQTSMTKPILSVGQVWCEPGLGNIWAREIIAEDFGNAPGAYPSVEWRRPDKMNSRWCSTKRFLKWIVDQRAELS